MSRPPLRRRSGFSLLELIVCLVLLAALGAGASSVMLRQSVRSPDAGMAMVQGVLERASQDAVRHQCEVQVRFDLAGGALVRVRDANNDGVITTDEPVVREMLPDGVSFAVPPGAVGLQGPVVSALVGDQLLTVSGLPTVLYRRHGSPITGVEVYLKARGEGETPARALQVTQSTGRVARYRWETGAWTRMLR